MTHTMTIRGRVLNTGGGTICVIVDRDTEEYPPEGANVEIIVTLAGLPSPTPIECAHCHQLVIQWANADGWVHVTDGWMHCRWWDADGRTYIVDDQYQATPQLPMNDALPPL